MPAVALQGAAGFCEFRECQSIFRDNLFRPDHFSLSNVTSTFSPSTIELQKGEAFAVHAAVLEKKKVPCIRVMLTHLSYGNLVPLLELRMTLFERVVRQ